MAKIEKAVLPMTSPTTVGAALKEITAHSASLYLTVGGTQYYFAAAKNWRITPEYKEVVEPVCGTQIPRVLTGHLDGKFEAELLYTTDDLLFAVITPDATTFELPEVTVTSVEKDVQSSQATKTLTFTCKIFGVERQGPADGSGVVRLKYQRGIMTGAPTYT
jgi:hypothetical protein